MKTGFVGVGDMGLEMAAHIAAHGHEVHANDIAAERIAAAAGRGARPAPRIADMPADLDLFILMVRTDAQVAAAGEDILKIAAAGSLIAVAGTHHPAAMTRLDETAAKKGVRVIDCPVVYGMDGARAGKLLSLCGGAEADIARARPVLASYSREVLHVGPLGAGQIAKTCNNLLHWQHAVGNFEALLLAKRYGLDAQKMREVLLKAPGANGTLERFEEARFTWHEKDMDVVMELAQAGGLVLPLSGQVDQLIKLLRPADVAALLHGAEVSYLGRRVTALPPTEGGLDA